jgi:glycerophosphoryl diester phosphodiesterase
MRRLRIASGAAAVLLGGLYLLNASWLAPVPHGRPGVLAHRGVHQTYRREGMTDDTCTAARMLPPTNPYLENTIASMKASFAAGATVLEVDVHPTTDGEFAVFHDWSLECRTNGHGVTRDQTMAYLKTLDIGYGYTADGGKTYPFRGKGVGLMPTLNEVFTAFPGKQFIIHIKSNDASEADKLVAYLKKHHRPVDNRLWVFAGGRRVEPRLRQLAPLARVMSRPTLKDCTYRYLAYGWLGIVPQSCRNNFIAVPVNLTWAVWGWPNRFMARMKETNVLIALAPPQGSKEPYLSDRAELDAVPPGFSGLITTDYIETIGPDVRRRWPEAPAANPR